MAGFLKKVGGVAQAAGGLFAGSGEEANDGGVEELLERISDGVLADDRRSAMTELRIKVTESIEAQLALASMGVPVLVTVLREERQDLEMIRGALEAMYNTMATELMAPDAPPDAPVPAKVCAEMYCSEREQVSLLLSLLDEDDFYVRYHCCQLLTALVKATPRGLLQQAVLSSPTGVSKLMDMLQEREVIRNEAVLLLAALTELNEEMKKIVVFEGCFERLIAVIREEGGAEGGIVVQDCLQLMGNLLRDAPSNQVFFRESSLLPALAGFLEVSGVVPGGESSLPPQRQANILTLLQALALLLAPSLSASDRKANQSILVQHKALDHLLPLALFTSSHRLTAEALWVVGELVAEHSANQIALGAATVPGGELDSVPALNMILRLGLSWDTADIKKEQVYKAALHVFEAYCAGNPDGQLLLASTVMPLEEHEDAAMHDDHRTFGGLLVRALTSSNTSESAGCGGGAGIGAALVLQHLLVGNAPCKERVLHIPLHQTASSKDHFLLPSCMRSLRGALERPDETVLLQGALLRLLVTWLTDCPPAVTQFLETAFHLPLVVETALGGGSVHVRGLATLLLGVAVLHNQMVGALDPAGVVDVVVSRLGLSSFFLNLDQMRSTPLFQRALHPKLNQQAVARGGAEAAGSSASGPPVEEPESLGLSGLYCPGFAEWVTGFQAEVGRGMVALYARPKQLLPTHQGGGMWEVGEEEGDGEQARLDRAHALIRTQDSEIAELRGRNVGLAERLVALAQGGGGTQQDQTQDSPAAAAADPAGAQVSAAAATAGQLEQSLARSQTLEAEIKELKRDKDKTIATLQAELAESAAQASRHEDALKSLSEAYNGLEADIYRHEEQERELRAQVRAAEERVQAAEAAGNSAGGGGGGPGQDAGALAAAREEGYSTAAAELTPKIEQARKDGYDEGREEAEKEGEGEMNDLLVCLGQEESKTERLRERLEELGEDVDALLEGVGVPDEDEDEEAED